jgi:hypothetical protein
MIKLLAMFSLGFIPMCIDEDDDDDDEDFEQTSPWECGGQQNPWLEVHDTPDGIYFTK